MSHNWTGHRKLVCFPALPLPLLEAVVGSFSMTDNSPEIDAQPATGPEPDKSTSTSPPNAVLREKTVLQPVLKHISAHKSEHVQAFYHSHIKPMMDNPQDKFGLIPQGFPQVQTNADALSFLEKMLYAVQRQKYGFLRLSWYQAVELGYTFDAERMALEYIAINAMRQGYYTYFTEFIGPSTQEAIVSQARKVLDPLENSLREHEARLQSDEVFFEFFMREGYKRDWAYDIGRWASHRNSYVRTDIPSYLLLDVPELKGLVAPLSIEPSTWDYTKEHNWRELDAALNAQLRPFTSERFLLEVKRGNMLLLKTIFQQKLQVAQHKRAQKARLPIYYYLTMSDMDRNYARHLRTRDTDSAIEYFQNRIKELEKCLASDEMVDRYEGEGMGKCLAKWCLFFADLDTPSKIASYIKQLYEEKEVVPLRDKLKQEKEKLERKLAQIDEYLASEKARCMQFSDLLFSCLRELYRCPMNRE